MIALSLALFTPDAAACGGFFCNNVDPVKQKGETVVFEVDKTANRTTMHVQVEFQGPASEFAWVIPVRGEPDLALSNDALFTQLESRTRPQFNVQYDYGDGTCGWFWGDVDLDANGSAPPPQAGGGVDVLSSQQVGPYDTVVLAATDTQVLLTWLQDNGYAVPNGMAAVIAPYLAAGHNFVALRLSSGNTTGDLEPLAMRYQGTTPAIPLHLTSVAAEEDMPITTYVLGDSRAVPQNYLHVRINYAAIDWFNWWTPNYNDVVTRAADQAGGHAFATDYAGPTEDLLGQFYPAGIDLFDFQTSTAEGFLAAVITSGLPPSRELLTVLENVVPIPEGTDARSVYNCPTCFSTELASWHPAFDGISAAAQLDAAILEPLRSIEAMFARQPHLTRLSSSVSPAEMTLDPMFALNPDILQVQPRIHTATLLLECDETLSWEEQTATLVLPDGNLIDLPSYQTLQDEGLYDYSTYLDRLQEPAAAVIESFDSEGPSTVIFDGHGEIRSLIDDLNQETEVLENGGKRGCSTTGGLGFLGLFALPALLVRRRD